MLYYFIFVEMEKIELQKSAHSPYILMDEKQNLIYFEGNLVVPDAASFFRPLVGWINNYFNDNTELKVVMKIDYFNTAASKMINTMFAEIKKGSDKGVKVEIDWYYQESDEDMAEMIQEVSEIAELEFNAISTEG